MGDVGIAEPFCETRHDDLRHGQRSIRLCRLRLEASRPAPKPKTLTSPSAIQPTITCLNTEGPGFD
jgi:hypothetical protein